MPDIDAGASGRFAIGELVVNRLGFGAMRVTGPGIWGEPADRGEALRTLRRLRDLGVTLVDTADAYGPFVSEDLIAEALHPYGDIVIATKGANTRPGPGVWVPVGRPEYLRQCVQMSLRRLKIERIDLWQLHRIDPKVPREEQFGVIADMIREGLIRHAGLSQVSVAEIEAAQRSFPVVTVQNRYNIADRADDDVLAHCEAKGIGFMPWRPLPEGGAEAGFGALHRIAEAHGASPTQIALAWLLRRSKVMLPIPGTGKVTHLEENVAAAGITLSDADFAALSAGTKPG
jgi:aryl-alcohol dehydrogenase-like predicted oxidoreductase